MKKYAFTLAEMLVAALVASVLLIVMAPVMTKKIKEPPPQIEISKGSTIPVGAIVVWYGDNIPEGWIECNGQDLNSPELSELKAAIRDKGRLPELNPQINGAAAPVKWIIKTTDN